MMTERNKRKARKLITLLSEKMQGKNEGFFRRIWFWIRYKIYYGF